MWKKFPEEQPKPDWNIDWCNRSVKCLVQDDWEEIHLARLQWNEDEWEYECAPRWYLDGRDDYLLEPRGDVYWISVEDLLEVVGANLAP